jgi:cytochrome P450
MADRQPRGPTGLPVVGSSLDFAADPLGFMERCAREYGDLAQFDTVNGEVYLLTHPEGIERVLSTNNRNYRKPDLDGEGLDGLLGDGLLTSEGDVRTIVPDRVPIPRNVRYRLGERRLERVVRDVVRQRERDDGERDGDVLGLLLQAREAGATEIDDEQLRDEVVTMLLAGHDTTALTLTYSWYLLSEHREVERKFHAELDSVLDGRDPTPGDVSELDYTE